MKGTGRKVIGLTGGIAAGKSTVGKALEAHGFAHIDADAISRELSQSGGAAHPLIAKRFGTADREKLRALVFSDPDARRDLEAILHPLIRAESAQRIAASPGEGPVIYEAALLVETGRYKELDGLIVVDAPREVRKKRLMQRNGWDAETVDRVLNAQIDDQARRDVADWILENTGTREDLEQAVERLAEEIRGRS